MAGGTRTGKYHIHTIRRDDTRRSVVDFTVGQSRRTVTMDTRSLRTIKAFQAAAFATAAVWPTYVDPVRERGTLNQRAAFASEFAEAVERGTGE